MNRFSLLLIITTSIMMLYFRKRVRKLWTTRGAFSKSAYWLATIGNNTLVNDPVWGRIIITLSGNHHSKSVKLEPNSHRFVKILSKSVRILLKFYIFFNWWKDVVVLIIDFGLSVIQEQIQWYKNTPKIYGSGLSPFSPRTMSIASERFSLYGVAYPWTISLMPLIPEKMYFAFLFECFILNIGKRLNK